MTAMSGLGVCYSLGHGVAQNDSLYVRLCAARAKHASLLRAVQCFQL